MADRADDNRSDGDEETGAAKDSWAGTDSPDERETDSARRSAVSAREEWSLRQRRSRLLALSLIALAAMTVCVWSIGQYRQSAAPGSVDLAPRVRFESLLEAFRREDGDTFRVTDYEVNDQMIEAIAGNESIETLILDRGVITDEGIDVIASLPNLRYLRLRNSPIGDEGIRRLAESPTLWYLNLPQAECTSAGLAMLAETPALRQLRIGSPNLGNDAARAIEQIRSLRGVHLIGVPLTDEGVKRIAGLPHLESLYLDDSAVTDAGWSWMFENHPHIHVHVNQRHHDRDPKAHPHHDEKS